MSRPSFNICRPAAARERLAARLDVASQEIDVHRFPDGELRVTVGPASPTTIMFTSLDQPNDKLLAILFAAEALRRGGATRLVLVAPYLCYMRQDAAFHSGEAISQSVIGRLIAQTVDRVVTVDAHLHRTKNIEDVFPGIEAVDLSSMPAIADYLHATGFDPATVVAGPDAESRALGARFGAPPESRLRGCAKDPAWRPLGRDDFADPAKFAGRPVLLVDDIVSSGGTLLAAPRHWRRPARKPSMPSSPMPCFRLSRPQRFLGRRPLDPLDRQRAASQQCD